LDPDPTAHHRYQLRGDAQPQADPSEAACSRAVSLCERIEDRGEAIRGNPDAGVLHAHVELGSGRPDLPFDIDPDRTGGRKFYSIVYEVHEHRPDPPRVACYPGGYLGGNGGRELQSLLPCARLEQSQRLTELLAGVEGLDFDADRTGL